MTIDEFKKLRKDEKYINQDIKYEKHRANILDFKIKLKCVQDYEIYLYGKYDTLVKSITFLFTEKDFGNLCRLDLNGHYHVNKKENINQGRNHKHELLREKDAKKNLPYAYRVKPENINIKFVWNYLCKITNIKHNGKFYSPEKEV